MQQSQTNISIEEWFKIVSIRDLQRIQQHAEQCKDYSHYNANFRDYNVTALMEAALSGDIETVKILSKFELRLKSERGNTAFIYACKNMQEKIALLLLDEADIADNDGCNGLMKTSSRGLIKVVEAILSKPELKEKVVRKQNNEGATAFMIACQNKYEEIALLLLDEVDIIDQDGYNGFMHACQYGLTKVVKAILSILELKEKVLMKQNNKSETAFVKACQNEQEEIALLLLDEAYITNNEGCNGLMWASSQGLVNVVEAILSKSELKEKLFRKLNIYGVTAFMKACENKQVEIALLLLDEAYITNNEGSNGLMWACSYGLKQVVEAILFKPELRKKVLRKQNSDGKTSFMNACKNKQEDIALLLLDEVDIADNDGWNGLMWASYKGLSKVVESILSKPELKEKVLRKQDKDDYTAFYYACQNKYEEIALLLIDEADILNNDGWNGLMWAIDYRLPKVVEAILSNPKLKEKLVQKLNIYGVTAFMKACDNKQVEIALLLLDEAYITNNEGSNGLMWACSYGLKQVVEAILLKPELKAKVLRKQNNKGETAFMVACSNYKEEIALVLVDEADIVNNNGWNGLMTACSCGLTNVVEGILAKTELKEKLLRKQNKERETAFMIAIKNNYDDIAFLLAEESNLIDNDGNTALIIAAQAHNTKIMKELIPSQLGLINKENKSALYYALTSGDINQKNECFDLLKGELEFVIVNNQIEDILSKQERNDVDNYSQILIEKVKDYFNALMVNEQQHENSLIRQEIEQLQKKFEIVEAENHAMFCVLQKQIQFI